MGSGRPETYVRLHATYRGRLGVEVGIFVAVDHLRRAGRLSVEEEELYFDVDDWFNAELPDPPFYADGNRIAAVTWFKKSAGAGMLRRLEPLQRLLDRHGVPHTLSESTDPGEIVYEDAFQIGVIPYERDEPSGVPTGITMGPTTSGSKRHLGRKAAAVRAVIFDFDGLILDTESPELSSWEAEFLAAGVVLDRARWIDCIGSSAFDPYEELERLTGDPIDRATVRASRRARYRQLIAGQQLQPGVTDYLAAARAHGLRVAIASTSTGSWINEHLEAHELLDSFDVICGSDAVDGRGKPAPDVYLKTVELLSLPASECIALEDSPNGVRAARDAGLRCIYVPSGLTAGVDCVEADLVIDSLVTEPLLHVLRRISH